MVMMSILLYAHRRRSIKGAAGHIILTLADQFVMAQIHVGLNRVTIPLSGIADGTLSFNFITILFLKDILNNPNSNREFKIL
jgi:hypothetical protein